jgi:histidyl-tRNA synthetase
VFELTHSKLGAQDALAAGGRYDKLVESLGGPSVGAVGYAVGVERLLMCLSEGKGEETQNAFFVVTLGEKAQKKSVSVLSELRKSGFTAQADFDPKSMKSQMRQADKIAARYTIILGDTEIEKNIFVLKDMKEGTQKELPLASVVDSLKKENILPC